VVDRELRRSTTPGGGKKSTLLESDACMHRLTQEEMYIMSGYKHAILRLHPIDQ
jgi:hypothetical protein